MYVHPAFKIDRAASLAFAAARGFGLVVACADGVPVASPLPFCLDYRDDGTPRLTFHVARANALATIAQAAGSWLVSVMGDDAYVSPNWYASPEQVPTWLYEAVHLSGPVHLIRDGLADHLDTISDRFERGLASKGAWTAAAVTPGRKTKLMQAIAGIEMTVESVEGNIKLNQHKSDADHIAVAAALADRPDARSQAIAARMVALRPHLDYEPVAALCD